MSGIDQERIRLNVLARAATALASELSLPAVLSKIVSLACEVSGARYGAVGVLRVAGGGIDEFIFHGMTDAEAALIGHLPEGKGILGALIDDERPLRLPRLQDDPRSVGFPAHHPPMVSFLGVPIRVRGVVYGNLYLTEKADGLPFTQGDEDAIIQLAAHAGIAIENARLHARLQRLALVEERERIAKDLHDDVIQSLFAEGMALQAAIARVEDHDAMRERLETAVERIDRVIRDLRNYIFGLMPGDDADRQLDRELRETAERFAEGGVTVVVHTEREAVARLAGRAADVMQAAREALSNAVRHAGAATVRLSLRWEDGAAVLEVADDGSGFDPAEARGRGHGLDTLAERAASLGGTLDIDSEPSAGTTVRIRIPR